MHTYCRKTEQFERHDSERPLFWQQRPYIVGEILDAIVIASSSCLDRSVEIVFLQQQAFSFSDDTYNRYFACTNR